MCRQQYVFRRVSDKKTGYTAPPNRAHYNQIGVKFPREPNYSLCGIPLEQMNVLITCRHAIILHQPVQPLPVPPLKDVEQILKI